MSVVNNVHYIAGHRVYAASDAVENPDVARIAGGFRRDDGLWYERDENGVEKPINLVFQEPIPTTDGGTLNKYSPNIVVPNHTVTVPTDTTTLLLPQDNVKWSDLAFSLNYPNDWTFNNGNPINGATGAMRIVPNPTTKNLDVFVATSGGTGAGTGGAYTGSNGVSLVGNDFQLSITSLTSLPV